MPAVYQRQIELPVSAADAYAWHARPGAIYRLMPPWEPARVIHEAGELRDGARAEFVIRAGPLPMTWTAEHERVQPGRQFEDRQIRGPFAAWQHLHQFETIPSDSAELVARCRLTDRIEYGLPGGVAGQWLGGSLVHQKIDRMFAFRHAVTSADLALHQRYRSQGTMKISVTGASGLVGSALVPLLTTGGHQVVRYGRSAASSSRHPSEAIRDAQWDLQAGTMQEEELQSSQAVVHLAGENIAGGRWTPALKQRIRDSRVNGTRLVAETLARLANKPQVLVCASAIGYYGDAGDRVCDDNTAPGTGFLAEVCQQWEKAAQPAIDAGIRVVNLRFGMILSSQGGALAKMLLPFKMGVGGIVGPGTQYWSWIALDDAIRVILHAIMTPELQGPVNTVSPQPVTNAQFTKTLGKVLNRPTILPMPAFAARLALGEMADHLILASARVIPGKLQASEFSFRFPDLESALRSC